MITDIRLQNFRSYKDASFEFDKGVNIIVGPNAAGKTNLLESILVLTSGKSYRAKEQELIGFNKPWARIDADFDDGAKRTIKITAQHLSQPFLQHSFRERNGGGDTAAPTESSTKPPVKTFEIDGKNYTRLALDKTIATVLFEPNQLLILSTSPDKRRDYLDDLLEQTAHGYKTLRAGYKRTLAQRNSLLKKGLGAKGQLFAWDIKLSQLAGQIVTQRLDLVDKISAEIESVYKDMSGSKTKTAIKYLNSVPINNYESQLIKKLEAAAGQDIERGFTSFGPHREDFVITFDGHPAAQAASRGEIRTAMLALKTIEISAIEAARSVRPLVLLDDVFSELDGRRRHALTEFLKDYQTFITTTDADLITKNFTAKCHVIAV